MSPKFYITTAIDYTNEVIHIGHIYQKIIADVLARYHRLLSGEVFFLTGTDEHGGKVEKAAEEAGYAGREKEFVDKISQEDKEEQESVEVSFDRFIRTTNPDHIKFVAEFWQKVQKNGDIYLGEYEGIYCEGCEAFLYKSDLKDGLCPYHPNRPLKVVKEKNYFFRWSKYADFLKSHLLEHPEFVWPEARRNEMLAFVAQGLADIPVSRSQIKWGIPVPGDESQTIYVWFDALINYLSGTPKKYWPADVHVLGKDNTRWHALLWPAMLKSAGYELPKTILVNGFLTLNGQKISKSLGNVVKASQLARQFGAETVRYYLLSSKPIDTDGDVNLDKLAEVYQADLANGLGNLVARVARLCETAKENFPQKTLQFSQTTQEGVENYQLNEVLREIWERIGAENRRINQEKPWELQGEKLKEFLKLSVEIIRQIAFDLQPFMPKTAEKITSQFKGPTIKSEAPLFPRL